MRICLETRRTSILPAISMKGQYKCPIPEITSQICLSFSPLTALLLLPWGLPLLGRWQPGGLQAVCVANCLRHCQQRKIPRIFIKLFLG
jgi:hypothetical protein